MEIRSLLCEYVAVRLEVIRSRNLEHAFSWSEELQNSLGSVAVSARERPQPQFAGYPVQSLNEEMALHSRRVTVRLEFRRPNHMRSRSWLRAPARGRRHSSGIKTSVAEIYFL